MMRFVVVSLMGVLLFSLQLPVVADPTDAKTQGGAAAKVKLLDLALLDQEGSQRKFRSEVVGDKIVVIDFIYTACTTACPLISVLIAKLQENLGERLGKEVRLVSISLDPVRDTPARLREHVLRYQAQPGWIWLTGEKPQVDQILKGLGAYAANFTEHLPQVLIGDGRLGGWTRYYGLPDPAMLLARVEKLLSARLADGSATVQDTP
jgi:protein SCO1/2